MWEYSITTHTLKHNGSTITSAVYAGAPGFKNAPSAISLHDLGPLPPGTYRIGHPYHNHHTGPYTLNLIPESGNHMFGRNAFRIHGDSSRHPGSASNGCIITNLAIRHKVWNSNDHLLKVIL